MFSVEKHISFPMLQRFDFTLDASPSTENLPSLRQHVAVKLRKAREVGCDGYDTGHPIRKAKIPWVWHRDIPSIAGSKGGKGQPHHAEL